jgi:Ca2+-transporting ATPase
MKSIDNISWHQLQLEEVFQRLEADPQNGLAQKEIQKRQKEHGLNQVTPRKGKSPFIKFLLQFHQPLVYILLVATGITASLGEWVDSGVIFSVVLVNAIVGFLQESKAEKAIEALAKMVVTKASVRRERRKQQVPSVELVPGDIVLLQSGDKVPADLRLYHVRNLQVDESMLTGESVPVTKDYFPLAHDTILAERNNLVFAGTFVTAGQAEGVVWATGDKTETGRIATLISEAADLSTPLTKKIAHFSKLLLVAILGLSALTFLIGIWQGHGAVDMFMAAVALAVGAIPEGLPAAITITLAIGVSRMARRKAVIRKLPAVETLGSTTVICSDKTGTLTENRMTVQEVFVSNQSYEIVSDTESAPGQIHYQGQPITLKNRIALLECLKAGLLCNDAVIIENNGQLTVQGDPTEGALIIAAKKAGLQSKEIYRAHPRLDVIPFESEYQYMATLHQSENQNRVIYKKGAMESLLEKCVTFLDNDGKLHPLDITSIHQAAEAMANRGMRVLAFAKRHVPSDQNQLEHRHVAENLIFLGLQGMMDPPRIEAIEAVRECQNAGIEVKMITGDHALTARAIAQQIGLQSHAKELIAISGRELDKLSEDEFQKIIPQASVLARVTPEQKVRVVKTLQAKGHIVAMTGDGVNDAPALKQADIGVAMGITGTDVAKGAADMVLMDDNFASIKAAVEEGRGVFDNLTKFLVWTLPTNAGEATVLLAAIVTGVALPLLPVQLLWINMTTALFLGLTLVFEPGEKNLMSRPPRDPKTPILTLPLVMRSGLVTLIILMGAFGLFWGAQKYHGASLAEARTITVNTIVMVEMFYLLNCRSLTCSMFAIGLFSNPWILLGLTSMILLQLAFTYLPLMNHLFHTAPLSPIIWLYMIGIGLVSYAVVGIEKWLRFHCKKSKN